MSGFYNNLDDAAMAALLMLTLEQDPKMEHMGALYAAGDTVARTEPITTNKDANVSGTLRVPQGSLRALFHNHPLRLRSEDGRAISAFDRGRADFSAEDRQQAKQLRVPSYIYAGDRVMRYDPTSDKTEEVLAEFPIEEWMKSLRDSFKLARINVNNPVINNIEK